MITDFLLETARKRIENPDHWTKGVLARDHSGNEVAPDSPDACQWCAIGAVEKAAEEVYVHPHYVHAYGMKTHPINKALIEALGFLGGAAEILSGKTSKPIEQLNDHPASSHSEILHMFSMAIDSATLAHIDGKRG